MHIKFCSCCTKNLKTLDVVFDLYKNICECYLFERKPFSLPNIGLIEFSLSILEKKGLVLSVEDENSDFIVKPLGIYLEETFICAGICEGKGIMK